MRIIISLIVLLQICEINAQNSSIYEINLKGKYNTGSIIEINPSDCSVKTVKNFDRHPLSSFLPNLVKINGIQYGVATYGGDKNFGGIFKLIDSETNLKEVLNFSDSLEYRPQQFLKYRNNLLVISVNYYASDCSDNECVSYLYTIYKVEEDSVLLEKQSSKSFVDGFFKFDLLDSNNLVFQNEVSIWQLNLNDLTFKEVFSFDPQARTDELNNSYSLQNFAVSYISEDGNLNGIFKRRHIARKLFGLYFDKKEEHYSYDLNLLTNEFSYKKKNYPTHIDNLHYRYRDNLSSKDNTDYYKGKLLYYDNRKQSHYLSKNSLKRFSKIKWPYDGYPAFSFLTDTAFYTLGIYEYGTFENGIRSLNKIGFFKYDLKQRKYEEVQLIKHLTTFDILFTKIENDVLYLVSLGKIETINLKNYKGKSFGFDYNDSSLINPNFNLYNAGNGNFYGTTGRGNNQKLFRYNVTSNKLKFLSNISYDINHFFKVDSCRLAFVEFFRSSNFIEFNQCNGKITSFQYERDSIYQKTTLKNITKKHPANTNYYGRDNYRNTDDFDLNNFYTYLFSVSRGIAYIDYNLKSIEVYNWETNKQTTLSDSIFNSFSEVKALRNLDGKIIGFDFAKKIAILKNAQLIYYDFPKNFSRNNKYVTKDRIYWRGTDLNSNKCLFMYYDLKNGLLSCDLINHLNE